MGDTSISWTDKTWNPTQGCSRVSTGCERCYAERMAARFARDGWSKGLIDLRTGKWTGAVRLAAHKLADPLTWRAPKRVFVNSMSDLFHERLSNEDIAAVFGVMAACPQHSFQVLTKRPERMRAWFEWIARERSGEGAWRRAMTCWYKAKDVLAETGMAIESSAWNADFMNRAHLLRWPLANVWLGVSVENQDAANARVPLLLEVPAVVRFLSCEPLLGRLDLVDFPSRFNGWLGRIGWHGDAIPSIGWVIAGCESGPDARPCAVEWLRSLRDQCAATGVPFHLKQADTRNAGAVGGPLITLGRGSKRKGGGLIDLPYLDGVQHAAFPEAPAT